VSVAFGRNLLFAAGAGLFAPEGNHLVPTTCSSSIEDAQATSVAFNGTSTVYIGTLLGGVLVSTDKGETLVPRNAWVSLVKGCGTTAKPSVPVRVGLSSQRTDDSENDGSLLWVLTQNGHLFRSDDHGKGYDVVLDEARVMAHACDAAGAAVAALAQDGEGLAVYWSADGREFERRAVPKLASALEHALEPQIAVRGDIVLVGDEDLQEGSLYWPAGANEFIVLEDCPRATALEVRGDTSSPVLLAGLFFAGRDMGTLLRKCGDDDWIRVCDIGRLEGLFAIDKTGLEDISTRIHGISVSPSSPLQTALATGHGVFVLEMKDA
jgi:photosystem II stability/assembly factor-like uncharacterized protein